MGKQEQKGHTKKDAAPILPKRKHLPRLERIFDTHRAPIYYITICVEDRRCALDNNPIHDALVQVWRASLDVYGWMVGRYMVMPDHIHFFAAPNTERAIKLSEFGGRWKGITRKNICSIGYPSFNWQPEFFDHLIRNERSYIEKLDYICQNPVRAQLVANTADWPYQGEIYLLKW